MYYYYYVQKQLRQFEKFYSQIKEYINNIEVKYKIVNADTTIKNQYYNKIQQLMLIEEKYGQKFRSYEERIYYEKLKIQIIEIKKTTQLKFTRIQDKERYEMLVREIKKIEMLSRVVYSYNENRELTIWINDKKKRYYYQQMVITVQKLL